MKNNMRKYFLISGYWLDDGSEFYDYLVTNFDDEEEDGRFSDEDIFFYGMEEQEIVDAIKAGGHTLQDFAITSYREI